MRDGRTARPSSAGRNSSSARSYAATHTPVSDRDPDPGSKKGDGGALVEDEEALEHLKLVLVGDGAPDLVVELCVRERHLRAQALVRQRRPGRDRRQSDVSPKETVAEGESVHELSSLVRLRVVRHREVHIE